MCGMDETVKALEVEGLEVRMLRNSLDASLSKAITALDQTQSRMALARKNREVLIEQRRSEVKNAHSLQVSSAETFLLRGDLHRLSGLDQETRGG